MSLMPDTRACAAQCGDGAIGLPNEQCDDMNLQDGDGVLAFP